MSSFPWRGATATAVAAAVVLRNISRHQQQQQQQLTTVTTSTVGATLAHLAASFAAVFVAQSVAWWLWQTFLYPQYFSPLRTLPGPTGDHWLLGQFPLIGAQPTGTPMLKWISEIPHEGIIRYRGFFNRERILLCSPKALAEVLVTRSYDFVKPPEVIWTLTRLLGDGILVTEGDVHKGQRRSLSPAFAFRHVKNLHQVFWSKASECANVMAEHVAAAHSKAADDNNDSGKEGGDDAVELEISSWASRATLDIIGLAGMGQDFNTIRDPGNALSKTYARAFGVSSQARLLALLAMTMPIWIVKRLPLQRNGDLDRASHTLRETCRRLVQQKKERLANHEPANIDILSVAIASGGFTDDNLVDQMMTFLGAGHETTASALTWCIYRLCLNPDMQTRLRAEVRAHLPSPTASLRSAQPTPDTTTPGFDKLPYLNAVCSEVLRYTPPVPITVRIAQRDTQVLDVRIPRGTRIMILPNMTNRDPAVWGPTAHEFDPTRWLADGAGGAASNFALLTFLHGPRSCIGMGFARAELAALVAALVGRFEFALACAAEYDEKNVVIGRGITQKPANGLRVRVRAVEGW